MNAWGAYLLGVLTMIVIVVIGFNGKTSIINSPLLVFEITNQGINGMFIKYQMAMFLGIFGEDEDARPEHSDELQRIVFDYRRELGHTKAEKESAAQRRAARRAKEIRYRKQGRSVNSTRRARRGGHHLYKRLGVSKYASRKQIRNKYKKLKKSKKLTRKIREAYKVLSNKKSRKKYNNRYRKMKRKKRTRRRK